MMHDLQLRTVTRKQGNTRGVTSGEVAPNGCSLVIEEVSVLVQAFRRMVRDLEYDVCEMAVTTYLCAKAHGKPFTALPVFPVRGFHHGAIRHNTRADLGHPEDLEGRRVGVNRGYTVTTGVWARGILQTEYGVDLDQVTWVRSDDEHVAEQQVPSNVARLAEGVRLADELASGALPAAVGAASIDHPDVVPLIPDAEAAGYAAFEQRGLYPINHLIVVRDELLDAHGGLAADLFETFAESKRRYVDRLRRGDIDDPTATDRMHRRVMDLSGADPLPYGVAPNRAMIDELMRHAVDQHILDRSLPIDELFAVGTHDLTA